MISGAWQAGVFIPGLRGMMSCSKNSTKVMFLKLEPELGAISPKLGVNTLQVGNHLVGRELWASRVMTKEA